MPDGEILMAGDRIEIPMRQMRSFWGRAGHALAFELVLLLLSAPVVALVFDKGVGHAGVMGVVLSTMAMVCNGFYNYGFDRALIRLNHPLYPRSFRLRCLHSILFELCLLVFTLPFVMWWMDLSFARALALDLSFVVLVPVYALGFNWAYDLFVPVGPVENPLSK